MMERVAHSPLKAWILACRPKTLTAGVVPVIAGAAFASSINEWILICTLMTACLVQIGTNLFNDALDFQKGADDGSRLGPERAAQSGWISVSAIYRGGIFSFAMAAFFAVPLVFTGGVSIALLLVASLGLGYAYTGGPFPLAYKGLGEVFVYLFFGLASTAASAFLQTGSVPPIAWLAGSQIGLLAVVLIAVNNLRDIAGDLKAGKRTLAVQFGEKFAKLEIGFCALFPFALSLGWYAADRDAAAIYPAAALPLAVLLVNRVWISKPSAVYNRFLGLAAMLHLSFGILLTLAIFLHAS